MPKSAYWLYRTAVVSRAGELIIPFYQSAQQNAKLIAELDCLSGFAKLALDQNYIEPELTDGFELDVKGRHPVIEKQLPLDQPYIANDVYLDKKNATVYHDNWA